MLVEINSSRELIQLQWLSRLRWSASVCQIIVFVVAKYLLDLSLDSLPFALITACFCITNLILQLGIQRFAKSYALSVRVFLLADVLLITLLLYFYGGQTNPFSSFYLVHVILAGLLAGPRFTWLMVVLTNVCFLALFFWHVPVQELQIGHHEMSGSSTFSIHLQGMFLTFFILSVLLAYFISRVRLALDAREKEIWKWRERSENEKKLASLTTLSAGAAHELRTPLGTIALALGEMEHNLDGQLSKATLKSDLCLIREQLTRCEQIVRKMGLQAGDLGGEMPKPAGLLDLLESVKASLDTDLQKRIVLDCKAPEAKILLPLGLFRDALLALVKNGIEASLSSKPVLLRAELLGKLVRITIADQGVGISADLIERVGEPFYTTKGSRGLGLGVFLAKLFTMQVGGKFEINSVIGQGTEVKIDLPTTFGASV